MEAHQAPTASLTASGSPSKASCREDDDPTKFSSRSSRLFEVVLITATLELCVVRWLDGAEGALSRGLDNPGDGRGMMLFVLMAK